MSYYYNSTLTMARLQIVHPHEKRRTMPIRPTAAIDTVTCCGTTRLSKAKGEIMQLQEEEKKEEKER